MRAAAIAADGVVLPASFPELVGRGEEVLGRVIAVVMGAVGRKAHAARAAVEIAGDDVPADPALGEMVERRKFAGQLIGMLEGQVRGDAEAEMLGDERHGGYQQCRVGVGKLHGMVCGGVGIAAIDVVHAEHIRQEDAVEQPSLRGPGVVSPIFERVVVDRRIARMRP